MDRNSHVIDCWRRHDNARRCDYGSKRRIVNIVGRPRLSPQVAGAAVADIRIARGPRRAGGLVGAANRAAFDDPHSVVDSIIQSALRFFPFDNYPINRRPIGDRKIEVQRLEIVANVTRGQRHGGPAVVAGRNPVGVRPRNCAEAGIVRPAIARVRAFARHYLSPNYVSRVPK